MTEKITISRGKLKVPDEPIIPFIEAHNNETPEDFWNSASALLQHDMFALCALDEAYNDLYSRRKGKKLYELWDYDISNNPLSF